MTPGHAGQLSVVAIVVAVLLYKLGFFRGFRYGRRERAATTSETVNVLSRIDGEAQSLGVVRGSYRSRRTPIAFPIPVDPDHQSHVDH